MNFWLVSVRRIESYEIGFGIQNRLQLELQQRLCHNCGWMQQCGLMPKGGVSGNDHILPHYMMGTLAYC